MANEETVYYIKVEDGIPVGNPMDLNSVRTIGYFENGYRNGEIPAGYERYKHVPEPDNLEWYQRYFEANSHMGKGERNLHKVNDAWQKIWTVETMNENERAVHRVREAEAFHLQHPEYTSCVWSDTRCGMEPPVPCPPECVVNPKWNEAEQKWEGQSLESTGFKPLTEEEKAAIRQQLEDQEKAALGLN